eukprot:m51a1_g4489 hypothetical protein (377) ;mRNA; r:291105-307524
MEAFLNYQIEGPLMIRVQVGLVEARGLVPGRLGRQHGWQVWAYATFHLSGAARRKVSPYVRNSADPKWNLRYDMESRGVGPVQPLLFDVALWTVTPAPYAHEFLGAVSFDLRRPVAAEGWHELGVLPQPWDARLRAPRSPGGSLRLLVLAELPLAPPQPLPGPPYLRGLLRKRTPKRAGIAMWLTRWFVQFGPALAFFVPGRALASSCRGFIDVRQVVVAGPPAGAGGPGDTVFVVRTAERSIWLKAPDRAARDYWLGGLEFWRRLLQGLPPPRASDPEAVPYPFIDHSSNNYSARDESEGTARISQIEAPSTLSGQASASGADSSEASTAVPAEHLSYVTAEAHAHRRHAIGDERQAAEPPVPVAQPTPVSPPGY